jgi:hypothetical protein
MVHGDYQAALWIQYLVIRIIRVMTSRRIM